MGDKNSSSLKKETSGYFITNIVLTTRIMKLVELNKDMANRVANSDVG